MRLGDKLEYIFKATGVKFIVSTISKWLGVDCGCDKRKEKLNEFKFNRK